MSTFVLADTTVLVLFCVTTVNKNYGTPMYTYFAWNAIIKLKGAGKNQFNILHRKYLFPMSCSVHSVFDLVSLGVHTESSRRMYA